MIEEITYQGWKNNLRLRGKTTELVITLDVGPRILRYGPQDGENVFVELPEQMGQIGEEEWRIRGGHRFWTAPEADHSYTADNDPVTWRKIGEDAVEIMSPGEKTYGFQKTLRVELLKNQVVRVTHRLGNIGSAPLQATPWALSVMKPGGTAVIPQPALDLHPAEFPESRQARPEEFLPNRELVMWPFTDLTDGRYAFSKYFLRLSHKAGMRATKLGLKLPTGWIAYQNGSLVFAKHFAYQPSLPYPDRGVNCELFTNTQILEMESLAPLVPIAPGAAHEHVEHWILTETELSLEEEISARDFFEHLPVIDLA